MSAAGKRLTPELAPGHTGSTDYFVKKLAPYKPAIAALPFLLFAAESVLATACARIYADSDPLLKLVFSQLLALNTVMAGLLHFFPPMRRLYTSMISALPYPRFWLHASGLALMLAGLALVFPPTQVRAAWALVALLVAVFPANLACVVCQHPRNVVFGGSVLRALARLPFQFTFIAWALWFTSAPLPVPAV